MRFRTDTRGLGVAKLFFTLVTSAGLGLSMGTSFLIVRGPFLGGPSLDPFPMMAALAVFVAGIVVLTWGSTRLFGVGTGA
ncbi:hypothetical protein [Haloferax volcanii]|uniref:DUF8132 domain-containing protein n=3 Tax=Haloferax volcanii TaxID=2246 RepID=D4GXX7_HALVD|nr:hypothetical protein [Haloferax volcanii]ADE04993.1 uncharacterized protein HVO_1404 [Haloferax volcanii DS2]ELY28359.1 hypothetical protein C498_11716 [Haloferax volcanii DS2]MBS8117842.1 hypothetical protein [Haloferax volcanii]MBS8122854.1 hypothetical protein [Haloferax volcanii]MBS8126722.1 hypothetical protein [Haloferax volcanii]